MTATRLRWQQDDDEWRRAHGSRRRGLKDMNVEHRTLNIECRSKTQDRLSRKLKLTENVCALHLKLCVILSEAKNLKLL
jgi:hypothetical protein